MIKFINGGVKTNREDIFLDEIYKSVSDNRNVLVIIPDQFSFEYDKKLYDRLGAVLFNKITTAGFNRLARMLEEKYGGCGGNANANDNAKIILMYRAIKSLREKKELTFYTQNTIKNKLEKGKFISELITLVEQLRESGISPEIMEAASINLSSIFANKYSDLMKIYKAYLSELENAHFKDSVSDMAQAVRTARENNFFKNTDIFIDAFSSFTYDEKKMLELCISQADNLTLSFVIDYDAVKNSIHPFRMTQITCDTLKNMANNKGYNIIQAKQNEKCAIDIAYLGSNLFNVSKIPYKDKSENIRVLSATEVYTEASFVCAQIQHLVKDDGYRYSEIAVILRNISDCSGVFEGMMERYDIPYFIDVSENVSASALVQYFNTLLKCVSSKKYKTENILRLVKSPLFTSNSHISHSIEQYCEKWNVDGDMWTKEYFGLDRNLFNDYETSIVPDEEKKITLIDSIEKIRKTIILPFEEFRKKCTVSGGVASEELCEAFYKLLEKINISDRTYSVVRTATLNGNDTQIELARSLRQLWNSILSAVKSIYDIMGNDKITLSQFSELFKLMLSQMSVSRPPQKIDCVRIADASHSRLSNVKVAFVCQVNDEIFPKAVSSQGLLSQNDINLFQSALEGITEQGEVRSFNGDVRNDFMKEELACYNALTLPERKLYVTYIESDLVGKEITPSSLIREITDCFKDIKIERIHELKDDFFCTSYKSAYFRAIEHFRDNTSYLETVKKSLSDSEYGSKLYSFANNSEKFNRLKTNVNPDICSSLFFKDNETTVSASQLDIFNTCSFAYFCRYGLKLKTNDKMDLTPIHKGNIIHKLLEVLLSKKNEDGELCLLDNSDNYKAFVKKTIDECFEEYYVKELKSDFGKSAIFNYMFNELKEKAFEIVKFVRNELTVTNFRPEFTEYKFGTDEEDNKISFELDNNRKINLTGSIDRVDVYKSPDYKDTEYVRIIDYKTGSIEMKDEKIAMGLNLQMFVYLDAFLKSGDKAVKKICAGVEYFSFKEDGKYISDRSCPPEQYEINKEISKLSALKPIGIIVDREDIEKVLVKNDADLNSYTPLNKLKNGNITHATAADKFFAITQYAGEKVKEFGNCLASGNFPAQPYGNVCSYCDYRVICGRESNEKAISENKSKMDEILTDFNDSLNKIIVKNSLSKDEKKEDI